MFIRDVEKGTIYPKGNGRNLDNIISNCKSEGTTCAEWIKRNGWKIPKDYPW